MSQAKKRNQSTNKYRGGRKNYGPDKSRATDCKTGRNDFSTKKFDVESPAAGNDPAWYAQNDQLLRDAASLSYANALGTGTTVSSPFWGAPDAVGTTSTLEFTQSGIMTISTALVPGKAQDANSPVNVAARNIYSFVRHANSGHSNYDAPDLMLYLLAMDQAYAWWSSLTRLYGVMRLYGIKNRYLPARLVNALGFDYNDIMPHLSELRFHINTLAVKLSAMCVPTTMSLFRRHLWMFQNVYSDGQSQKAQLYAYVPDGFFKYNETDGPGKLVYDVTMSGRDILLKWYDILAVSNKLLDPIFKSEDMNIMSGDILKAYGAEKCFRFTSIPEDYSIYPTYVPEVLSQIHNSRALGHIAMDGTQDITQNTDVNEGWLQYTPSVDVVTNYIGSDMTPLINMHSDDVSPADTMVATRLCGFVRYTDIALDQEENSVVADMYCFGTEIVTQYKIWRMNNGDVFTFASDLVVMAAVDDGLANATSAHFFTFPEFENELRLISAYSQFDWAPMITYWSLAYDHVGNSRVVRIGTMAELQNYTTIDLTVLDKMHQTAILSEFGVPTNIVG